MSSLVQNIAICFEVGEDKLGFEYIELCRQTLNKLEEEQSVEEMTTIIAATVDPILQRGKDLLEKREQERKNTKKLYFYVNSG